MTDELSQEERLELERRRLTEAVAEAVERALKKRYAFLGAAVAVAGFIGGGLIINSVTAPIRVQTDSLNDVVSQLTKLSARVDELTGIVETLAETTQEPSQPETYSNVSRSLNDLKTQQTALDEQLSRSSDRIKLGQYSVYVHFYQGDPSDRPVVERIASKLGQDGFVVPSVVRVGEKKKNRSIRYYHEADKDGALLVQEKLTEIVANRNLPELEGLRIIDKTDFPRKKPRPGVIELWLFL
jgi:hypothetical protein